MVKGEENPCILFLGTFPPRECGIATFTQDLSTAVQNRLFPNTRVKIAAMNRNGINIYNYPEKVIHQINDADIDEYIETAKKINNQKNIKLVSIQHEFGIFGGEYGSYLIPFLEILEKPCVITFHSILPKPSEQMRKVVQSMAEKSSAFIVMAEKGKEILREDYGVKNDIFVVPHGIPTASFESPLREKTNLGYKGRIVLSSFGMVAPGKGYEDVIASLPKVVEKFPNLLYLIVGETHPIVRKKEGEAYRNSLEEKIKKLGLQKNVKFYNKYMKLNEIIKYLKASDIYISSGQDPNQVTSGTLVYAMGCGRPVVSTPFLHAQEAVNENRGFLAEFNNPESFSNAIIKLLSDKELQLKMRRNSYHYTRHMTWPNVALAYERIFNKYTDLAVSSKKTLPTIKMNHLMRLTDNFGIIQFARNIVPDLESGYTTDDNARAMMASCLHYDIFKSNSKLTLINTYLNYLNYVQDPSGKLLNYVDKNKKIDMVNWSEDAHGRAIWSLGCLLSRNHIPFELKKSARKIFKKSLLPLKTIESPRAIAFSIIGLSMYNLKNPSQENIDLIKFLADKLVVLYKAHSEKDWNWFEKYLTYSNSKLSEALFYAYLSTNKESYKEIAKTTLDFLNSITFENDMFVPIGQRGWYLKDGKRAHFDQQPVDVGSMVQTLVIAHKVTNNEEYMDKALNTFQWFLGNNSLHQVIYNETTGGCYDGLGESSININQGAESTISYLLARLAFIQ